MSRSRQQYRSSRTRPGDGGKNPALRIFFYRLVRLLALPIYPLFVYDGKRKPLLKRGKSVLQYGTCMANEASNELLQLFGFPHHTQLQVRQKPNVPCCRLKGHPYPNIRLPCSLHPSDVCSRSPIPNLQASSSCAGGTNLRKSLISPCRVSSTPSFLRWNWTTITSPPSSVSAIVCATIS